MELFLSMRLSGSVCRKHPSDKQELVCEQGVLDSRLSNSFYCIFLTFLPLFRNHLKILGVVFATSVKILCAFSLPLHNHCYVKIQTSNTSYSVPQVVIISIVN